MSNYTDEDNEDKYETELSTEALIALNEVLKEQAAKEDLNLDENWQLSQFWYDDKTTHYLSLTALSHSNNNTNIALISCPTLYKSIKMLIKDSCKSISVKLFEYDKRFSVYETDFIFYDYKDPLNLNSSYENYFDFIIADPPFLSEECLSKTAETIKFLSKDNAKVILCTGAVMESLANELLNVKKCNFKPEHKNNLGNEFFCYSNFGELIIHHE